MLTRGRLSEVYEQISKGKIPAHQKNLIFEVAAEDRSVEEGEREEVDVPYIMVKLRK